MLREGLDAIQYSSYLLRCLGCENGSLKAAGVCESVALSSVDKQKTFDESAANPSVFIIIY